VALLPRLSRSCYNQREKPLPNRTHFWVRRPLQIISLRTNHQWPDAEPHPSVRAPAPTGPGPLERGEKHGWIWRSRLHRF
jgi:hypothetical protein